MEACYKLDLPVVSHCEDLDIIAGGIINKGAVSEALGVKGMDRTSEDTITAREVTLAESTGTRIHICHVSTETSVALIRDAKKRGVQVTCESAPHYMLLTDKELLRRDANWRMNPPPPGTAGLRSHHRGLLRWDHRCDDHRPRSPLPGGEGRL